MSIEELDDILKSLPRANKKDFSNTYLLAQCAGIQILTRQILPDDSGFEKSSVAQLLKQISQYLRPDEQIDDKSFESNSENDIRELLKLKTFFCHLSQHQELKCLFNAHEASIKSHLSQTPTITAKEIIQRLETHRQLVARSFRTGHGVIDLYICLLNLGPKDLNDERRQSWLSYLCDLLTKQLPNDDFNTAHELKQLNDNLDLLIKNNLPGLYRCERAELRTWLHQQLNSSPPIIGASGKTSGSRSMQARRFRMPGYPLVLVSTDVFQEGEDLHTFCDSVVHYGLSSSPISIEQKTGRVDRVGAISHRHLQSKTHACSLEDSDYIQVSFPFVRHSIEAIQVRKLCNNLNAFIGSLHEIGSTNGDIDEMVNTSRELLNKNEIPDQILDFLQSPYVPTSPPILGTTLLEEINADNDASKNTGNHILSLLKSVSAGKIDVDGGNVNVSNNECSDQREFAFTIKSARACGEIVLHVSDTKVTTTIPEDEVFKSVVKKQQDIYKSSLARTFAKLVDNHWELSSDAEMLIGNEDITCKEDLKGLFKRFQYSHFRAPIKAAPSASLLALNAFNTHKLTDYFKKHFKFEGETSITDKSPIMEVKVHLHSYEQRFQNIHIQMDGEFFKFESVVANKDQVKKLFQNKPRRLIELTWKRNRNIDLVEFIVRPDGCLAGRVCHPSNSLDFEELAFYLYTLAVESDRLEYLLKEEDEY